MLAAIMAGPGRIELRALALPELTEDDGLLRVEACGACRFDAGLYRKGHIAPAILGHQVFGTIARLGARAAERWDVAEGDRVVVEEYVPCRACAWCARGEFRLCAAAQIAEGGVRFGMTALSRPPGLWGGFAEMLYLPAGAVLHKVSRALPARAGTLALPLADAVQGLMEGGAGPGKSVLVIGCGTVGLGAVFAVCRAGARALLCGVSGEAENLRRGAGLGAEITIDAHAEDLTEAVMAATAGRGADIVLDTTDDTSGQVAGRAIACAAKGGVAVLGGTGVVPLNLGEIRRKFLTLKPVRGHSFVAVERAIALLETHVALQALCGEAFGLDQTDAAIRAAGMGARHWFSAG